MEKTKKIKRLIKLLAIAFLIIFVLYTVFVQLILDAFMPWTRMYCRYDTLKYIWSPVRNEYAELSITDKTADVRYFFKTLKNSCPTIPYMEKEYGFSIDDAEKLWLAEISKTDSDYEYIAALMTMCDNIPSGHIYAVDPDYDNYWNNANNSYEYAHLYLYDDDNIRYGNSWDRLLTDKGEKHSGEDIFFINRLSPDSLDYGINRNNELFRDDRGELITLDGMSYDDYVKNSITYGKLTYDRNAGRLTKKSLYFFLSPSETSEEVTAVFRMKDGSKNSVTLYNDYCRTQAVFHYMLNEAPYDSADQETVQEDKKAFSASKPVYYCNDEERNTGYLCLTRFQRSDTEDFYEALEALSADTLVLDLRYCAGGDTVYLNDVIYPSIFSENVSADINSWLPVTENNCKYSFFTSRLSVLGAYLEREELPDKYLSNGQKYIQCNESIAFSGSTEKYKKVYVLIGEKTFSAADMLAYALKQSDSAVVIGDNTGGEGTAASGSLATDYANRKYLFCEMLPESRLMFVYYPVVSFNSENQCAEISGTSPEIYSYADDNEAVIISDMVNSGDDVYSYENRLKWDNVLIEALEIIKEKENTK